MSRGYHPRFFLYCVRAKVLLIVATIFVSSDILRCTNCHRAQKSSAHTLNYDQFTIARICRLLIRAWFDTHGRCTWLNRVTLNYGLTSWLLDNKGLSARVWFDWTCGPCIVSQGSTRVGSLDNNENLRSCDHEDEIIGPMWLRSNHFLVFVEKQKFGIFFFSHWRWWLDLKSQSALTSALQTYTFRWSSHF